MADINELFKEAKELGILNIDIDGSQLTSEILQIAIDATRNLNDELDDDDIARKIEGANRLVATLQ